MLEVRDLTIKFRSETADTTAVQSLSFSLAEGETLAIVGESGSGKSVTALALTKLLPEPPTIYAAGDVLLDRRSILGCLLYTSPSPRDGLLSRMPSSA